MGRSVCSPSLLPFSMQEPGRRRVVSWPKKENFREKLEDMGLSSSKHPRVKQAHILLLGLDSAGKSTVLYKLKLAEDIVTMPTVGFNVEMLESGQGLSFTVWDVGGQQNMRAVWDWYCERADGLVYVVDSSADPPRLEDARRELERVLRNEHMRRVPVVLLANKQDKPGALSAEDVTRLFKVQKLCCDRSWYVQPCCALSGAGLAEGFGKLTEFVKSCVRSRADTFAFFKQN